MILLFSLIAAVDENFAIGYKNNLLCKIPDDMKRFKNLTLGKKVLVGRKTYQSLKNGLPGRHIIVATRQKNFQLNTWDLSYVQGNGFQTHICYDVDFFLRENKNSEEEIFVIGGEEIYRCCLPYANKIYLTRIHKKFSCADAFFPDFSQDDWKKSSGSLMYHDDFYFQYDFFWR